MEALLCRQHLVQGARHDRTIRAPPDHHGHAPHDLRRPLSRRAGRLRDSGGGRQRDRRGLRGRHRARRGADRQGNSPASRRSSSIPPPRTGRSSRIAGLGAWPKAIDPDYFKKHHGGKIPQGVCARVVPAAPDAWITALERFGTMSFGEVAQSAIASPATASRCTRLMAEFITEHEAEHRAGRRRRDLSCRTAGRRRSARCSCRPTLAGHAAVHGRPGEAPPLARAARPDSTAARDAFYRGDIARADRRASEGERRPAVRRGSRRTTVRASMSRSCAALRRHRSSTPAGRGARDRRCCRRSTCSKRPICSDRPQLAPSYLHRI